MLLMYIGAYTHKYIGSDSDWGGYLRTTGPRPRTTLNLTHARNSLGHMVYSIGPHWFLSGNKTNKNWERSFGRGEGDNVGLKSGDTEERVKEGEVLIKVRLKNRVREKSVSLIPGDNGNSDGRGRGGKVVERGRVGWVLPESRGNGETDVTLFSLL